ncbi:hypothetical protein FHP25_10420 [Vineibacter terrae]|uniref:Response regulator n=1 Tax=Vineibacter terrae TaxID=2586908 RepID=A0A5C8PQX4_9HYPH|nr:hypothetical protein [Vineibacter terrae]TXL77170.1 hypothetical protein FHP25_10420 [Vineibacter terrae]
MPANAVVVADDNPTSCSEIVSWLKAHDIDAHATSDASVVRLIEDVGARVVVCRPGSTGIALFHALQESADPPLIVLLSEASAAKDEVYFNGRLLVIVIRTPVAMAPLARFVKSVLGIATRGDSEAVLALASESLSSEPTAPQPQLRLVH